MTIAQIAKLAGTSKTSVSFYLNNKRNKLSKETVEKIKKIIKETGYKPNSSARELRLQVTNKVAIVVFDITQYFAQHIYKSVSMALKDKDSIISLYETHLDLKEEKRQVIALIESKVKAIIIQPSKKLLQWLEKIYDKYPESKTKIILIDSIGDNSKFGYVNKKTSGLIEHTLKQNKKDGIKKVIYVSNELSKLQIREHRFKQLERHTKNLGIKFEVMITENDFSKNNSLQKILKKDSKIKKAFWTNSAGNAFNLYSQLKKDNAENSTNTIVSFNECFFKSIINMPLISIDTKIDEIGKAAANQIINNKLENISI